MLIKYVQVMETNREHISNALNLSNDALFCSVSMSHTHTYTHKLSQAPYWVFLSLLGLVSEGSQAPTETLPTSYCKACFAPWQPSSIHKLALRLVNHKYTLVLLLMTQVI